MLHSQINSKVYTSPPQSHVSTPLYYEFPLSEQLNSSYTPNFKKLSAKSRNYRSQPLNISKLFDPKSLELIIQDSIKLHGRKCQLCEMTYSQRQMFQLCLCKHKYCENCLIEYVNFKINSMEEIRCPEESCDQKINLEGQIYSKLPEQLKKKYKRAHLWRQTIANPDLKLCPQQICDGQIDMKLIPPQCTVCRKSFCPECMLQRHEGNCEKIFEMTHKEWRRCPNCRMFINKSDGCNHITCKCHCEFCFVCLEKWDTTHYKCQEKQQMFYFNVNEVKHPLFVATLMIAFFPFLALAVILAMIVTFVIMIPVGAFMGIGYTLIKFYCLLCIVIVLLPIGALVGAVMLPFLFTIQKGVPECIHHFRRYRITLKELFLKISQNQSSQ